MENESLDFRALSLEVENARLREGLESEGFFLRALEAAVEAHCRGRYVPEEVARWCRTHAVNLNRKLAREKGEPLPPLDKHMKDFTKNDHQVR